MALVANPTFSGVSADGTTSTIADSTVYGGAEPLRTAVAVYLTAYKVDEDLVESALTVVPNDTPKLATSFVVTNVQDGRYKFYFIIADDWLIGTTYNQYDIVWDPAQEAFYEYINTSPTSGNLVTDATYWLAVPDPTTKIANVGTASESGNLIYAVIEKIIDFQTAKCYGNAAILVAKDCCDCDGDCSCDERLKSAADKIRILLTAMRVADTRQQYGLGEKLAVEATNYCDDCGCLD